MARPRAFLSNLHFCIQPTKPQLHVSKSCFALCTIHTEDSNHHLEPNQTEPNPENRDRQTDMPTLSPATATAAAASQKTSKQPKRISNPRRLLILTPRSHSNTTIPILLHSLTGVLPAVPPAEASPTTTTNTTNNDNANENDNNTSFAGYTTHAPLQITNKYYSADVPIWVDEIPIPLSSSSSSSSTTEGKAERGEESTEATAWKTSFLSPEAREVRDAIGAILIVVRNPRALISPAVPREAYDAVDGEVAKVISENSKDPSHRADVGVIKDLARIVGELRARIEEERNGVEEDDEGQGDGIGIGIGQAEVPGLVVLMDEHGSLSPRKKEEEEDVDVDALEPFTPPWWEEELYDMGIFGFEVISWAPSTTSTSTSTADEKEAETRNIYGELEGLPRIKEVLSTHEWGNTLYSALSDDEDGDGDDDIMAFLADTDRRAGESDGFRREVNQLEREMMGLRFAINEASTDTGEEEEGEEEIQVDNLEALMMRMRAIKGLSRPSTKKDCTLTRNT
jgi:hypothetical protein